MQTSQPNNECDHEVYENGKTVAVMCGPSTVIEAMVVRVRETAGVRIDWHYFGGRANVLVLGTEGDRLKAREELERCVPGFLDKGR